MDKLEQLKKRFLEINITKSWQYLLYIYLGLPVVLFVLAWALRDTGLGTTFGVIFHNYGLFVASPIPGQSLTGYLGLILGVVFIGKALKKKDWIDAGVSLGLLALDMAYFFFQLNYLLLQFIRVQ